MFAKTFERQMVDGNKEQEVVVVVPLLKTKNQYKHKRKRDRYMDMITSLSSRKRHTDNSTDLFNINNNNNIFKWETIVYTPSMLCSIAKPKLLFSLKNNSLILEDYSTNTNTINRKEKSYIARAAVATNATATSSSPMPKKATSGGGDDFRTIRSVLFSKPQIIHAEPAASLRMLFKVPRLYRRVNYSFCKPSLTSHAHLITFGERIRIVQPKSKQYDLFVFEYLEEYPMYHQLDGMCSLLTTLTRPSAPGDVEFTPFRTSASSTAPKGFHHELSEYELSPLLSDIMPGCPIQVIENQQFVAPVAPHTLSWDHMLLTIRNGNNNNNKYATLSPIRCTFAVGQMEPREEVPKPNSLPGRNVVHKVFKAYVLEFIHARKKSKDKKDAYFDETIAAMPFDQAGEKKVIRSILDECYAEGYLDMIMHNKKKDAIYVIKENVTIPFAKDVCDPEDLSAYYSMQFAQNRLVEMGILKFVDHEIVDKLLKSLSNPRVTQIAHYIKRQLDITPWRMSTDYFKHSNNSKLQVDGRGNPFTDSYGISFINKGIRSKANPLVPGNRLRESDRIKEPKKKSGSDADSRSLELEQITIYLQKYGNLALKDISVLGRWESVRKLIEICTKLYQQGERDDPVIKRFTRKKKQTLDDKIQEYQDDIQSVFRNMCRWIHSNGPPPTKMFVDDPMSADYMETIWAKMLAKLNGQPVEDDDDDGKTKKKKNEADLEKEMAEEFIREMRGDNNKIVPLDTTTTTTTDLQLPNSSSSSSIKPILYLRQKWPSNIKKKEIIIHTITHLDKQGNTQISHEYFDAAPHMPKIDADINDGGVRFATKSGDSIAKLGILHKGKLRKRKYIQV